MIITINDFGGGGGGSASSIKYEVVTELPTEGKVGVIYLIESEEPTEGDKFDEYIWLKDEAVYEKLGSMAKIDLDNYYTKEETDTELAKKQDTLISGVNIKTINGEDILGEGDITVSGGDEHFKYNPTEEFTDGIVVYGEVVNQLAHSVKYDFGKKFFVNVDESYYQNTAIQIGTDSSLGISNSIFITYIKSDNTLKIESNGNVKPRELIIYKNGIEYARHYGGYAEIINLPYEENTYEFEYVDPNHGEYDWGFASLPNKYTVFEIVQKGGAYLANNGDKKEIALKEDIAALEEQIGDINNALETIIG